VVGSLRLERYLPGVANYVFNSTEVIASCHLTTLFTCVVRCRVIGLPDTVAIHREWVAVQRYNVAACYEWPAYRCCPVAVLQTPQPTYLVSI
jgi:hypothetical protein